MVATLTKTKSFSGSRSGNGFGGDSPHFDFSRNQDASSPNVGFVGLLFFMATVTMLFGGLVSALLIRRASPDWQPLYLPPILWTNTAVLLFSSFALELARFSISRHALSATRILLFLAMVLGFVFLGGQILAWQDLMMHGVFLPSNPHASFFYLASGLHALHLLGGVIVLTLAFTRAMMNFSIEKLRSFVKLAAMYWHFLLVLWLALFGILYSM